MNLKAFFVATLQSALDLGIAVPEDVLRHVTPDVLSVNLPRPLWARLLTACVGAPKVDAQLVVETIGVPNLCEHIPSNIIWTCIQEIAQRTLGGGVVAAPSTATPISKPVPLSTPPPPDVVSAPTRPTPPSLIGPSIPRLTKEAPAIEPELEPTAALPARCRTPTNQRFRQASTGIGRLASPGPATSPLPGSAAASASAARRPQAAATPPPPPSVETAALPGGAPRVKRGQTEADFDLETDVGGKDDWKNALAVEDEQLVDWTASDETVTNGDELGGRKR